MGEIVLDAVRLVAHLGGYRNRWIDTRLDTSYMSARLN